MYDCCHNAINCNEMLKGVANSAVVMPRSGVVLWRVGGLRSHPATEKLHRWRAASQQLPDAEPWPRWPSHCPWPDPVTVRDPVSASDGGTSNAVMEGGAAQVTDVANSRYYGGTSSHNAGVSPLWYAGRFSLPHTLQATTGCSCQLSGGTSDQTVVSETVCDERTK